MRGEVSYRDMKTHLVFVFSASISTVLSETSVAESDSGADDEDSSAAAAKPTEAAVDNAVPAEAAKTTEAAVVADLSRGAKECC